MDMKLGTPERRSLPFLEEPFRQLGGGTPQRAKVLYGPGQHSLDVQVYNYLEI